jgi:hypothetical protein
MYEQAKEILQINLQINLIQLEEEKVKVGYFFILFSYTNLFSRKSKIALNDTRMDSIKSNINYNLKFFIMKLVVNVCKSSNFIFIFF